jgi:hypothetical protein
MYFEKDIHFWSPLEGLLLLDVFGQRTRNVGETGNKKVCNKCTGPESVLFRVNSSWSAIPERLQILGVGGYPLR